ncbi:hypothetical protein FOFC_07778 [Fusarium oxysporum]|nr:hypothetical protein FOFC_07778 [Fusarium oxysporum]
MSFLPRSRPHPFSRNRSLLLPTESIVSSCTPFRIISPVPHLYRLFRFLGYVFRLSMYSTVPLYSKFA